MMTANKEIFMWNENDSWWDYDKNGNVVLTPDAPPGAVKSFELYCEKMYDKNTTRKE
ncbi:MAG: hypothetical protein PUF12_00100 [Thermoflexaceae bacterium]|nr:hypothetical protein [Thermoflexaceae bacterium]